MAAVAIRRHRRSHGGRWRWCAGLGRAGEGGAHAVPPAVTATTVFVRWQGLSPAFKNECIPPRPSDTHMLANKHMLSIIMIFKMVWVCR